MGGGTFDPGAYRSFTTSTAHKTTDEIYSSRDMNKNLDHPYQGKLRFAPLDTKALEDRCFSDAKNKFRIVLTHCDQKPQPCTAQLYTFGPTRNDVRAKPQGIAA